MSDYRPIPIEKAAELAREFAKDQIVVWSYQAGQGQTVTTWGSNLFHSQAASDGGNHVKRAAGWPDEEARALPTRWVGVFGEFDEQLAAAVASGQIPKGPALATVMLLRDVVRKHDGGIGEQFVATRTEAV